MQDFMQITYLQNAIFDFRPAFPNDNPRSTWLRSQLLKLKQAQQAVRFIAARLHLTDLKKLHLVCIELAS